MSYPPLTPAELNKFLEACKNNNTTLFNKYFEKMKRYHFGAQEHINVAENSIPFVIAHDNHDMFDKLLEICQYSIGTYLWEQILNHAIPSHLWALSCAIDNPKIPEIGQYIQGFHLKQSVYHNLDIDRTFSWIASHSKESDIMETAFLCIELRNWDHLMSLEQHLKTPDLRIRLACRATIGETPDVVQSTLFDNIDENFALTFLKEWQHHFSSKEQAAIWSRLAQVYNAKQAQRIEAELEPPSISYTSAIKRKI